MSKNYLLKQQSVNEHTPINLCVFCWHNLLTRFHMKIIEQFHSVSLAFLDT